MESAPAQITLRFIPELSDAQYELFEVESGLLESDLIIKSYQPPLSLTENLTAAMCSEDATFKLKKSETSNTMMIASLTTGSIFKQTSVYVELEKTQVNRFQVARLI